MTDEPEADPDGGPGANVILAVFDAVDGQRVDERARPFGDLSLEVLRHRVGDLLAEAGRAVGEGGNVLPHDARGEEVLGFVGELTLLDVDLAVQLRDRQLEVAHDPDVGVILVEADR